MFENMEAKTRVLVKNDSQVTAQTLVLAKKDPRVYAKTRKEGLCKVA